jgi:hypothetical protein
VGESVGIIPLRSNAGEAPDSSLDIRTLGTDAQMRSIPVHDLLGVTELAGKTGKGDGVCDPSSLTRDNLTNDSRPISQHHGSLPPLPARTADCEGT